MKRRIFLLALIIIMILGLAGCEKEGATAIPSVPSNGTVSEPEQNDPEVSGEDAWLNELDGAAALGEYPDWGEWTTEDLFNRALAKIGSNFEPQGDYTWDNGLGLTVAVETSLARGLGSDDRWHIVPYYTGGFAHTPSPGFTSQVWRDERWISRYVVDERGMSQRLAEDLWTLLLYSDSLETLADNILSIDGMKEELANK